MSRGLMKQQLHLSRDESVVSAGVDVALTGHWVWSKFMPQLGCFCPLSFFYLSNDASIFLFCCICYPVFGIFTTYFCSLVLDIICCSQLYILHIPYAHMWSCCFIFLNLKTPKMFSHPPRDIWMVKIWKTITGKPIKCH